MKRFKVLLCIISVVACLSATGQQQEAVVDSSVKPKFKLSINYNSNLNFFGRTDSLKSSGVFPLAELWITPEFYINAAPIFVNNALQSFEYAGSVATIGYQKLSQKWLTGLYITKPIYKEESELVQSALKAQAGVNVSFLNKFLNLNLGGDLKFSNRTDAGLTGGVDHAIKLATGNGGVFVIDPSFYTYAGTQNFQRSYYQRSNSGFLLFPGNEQLVTESVNRFNVLAYEASLPVIYAKGKWMFMVNPAYIMPQNLINIPNRPDLSERGENMFYGTAMLKYSF